MLPFTTSWFLSSTTRRHWCPLPFRAAVYKCVQVFRYRNGVKIHCFLLLYILLVGLCFNSKAIDCQFKWHATGLMIFCKQWEVFIWLERWCQIQNNYNVLTFFIKEFKGLSVFFFDLLALNKTEVQKMIKLNNGGNDRTERLLPWSNQRFERKIYLIQPRVSLFF